MGLFVRIVTSALFQKLGPARGFTTLMGRVGDARLPGWLLRAVIRKYIRANHVNMQEFDENLQTYSTFNQFFTRALLPGCRSFEGDISSPADGLITAAGVIEKGLLYHVKGNYYPLDALLQQASTNDQGSFATIYLSPADYHRVHAPFDCTITAIRHYHGKIQTVNPMQTTKDPMLYCTNERVVLEGESAYGNFFLVLVGAVVVGRIKISIIDNFTKGLCAEGLSVTVSKGDEVGLFELGSTVILIMDSASLTGAEKRTGNHIKMGEPLC